MPMVSDVFFFVSGMDRDSAELVFETTEAEWKKISLTEAWVIRETDAGTLYKLQEKDTILFDSITIIN